MPNELEERARECLARIAGNAVHDVNADGYYHVSACLAAMIAFTQEAGWMPIEQRLREPTEEMWNAAWEASGDYFVGDDVTERGFRLGLSAMIEAALRPLPAPPALDPHSLDRAGMMQEVE